MQGDLINNANTCGYCGDENCSIQLKITSGFGAKATYGPYSNCDNFVKFSLAGAKKSKPKKPCTNHPTTCKLCNITMWSYNIHPHYNVIQNMNHLRLLVSKK